MSDRRMAAAVAISVATLAGYSFAAKNAKGRVRNSGIAEFREGKDPFR